MARAASSPCSTPGCPTLVQGGGTCGPCTSETRRRYDARRGSARERGYDSRWEGMRRRHLRIEPFCRQCMAEGKAVVGKVVDHVIPHRGARWLFDMPENLQTLCLPCHGAKSGQEAHLDLDVIWPLEPSIAWVNGQRAQAEEPRLAELAYWAHLSGADLEVSDVLGIMDPMDTKALEAMHRRAAGTSWGR